MLRVKLSATITSVSIHMLHVSVVKSLTDSIKYRIAYVSNLVFTCEIEEVVLNTKVGPSSYCYKRELYSSVLLVDQLSFTNTTETLEVVVWGPVCVSS